jgi:hypothetical protein
MVNQFKHNLRINLSNLIGWRTNKKILVMESDDWGSIRNKDKTARDKLFGLGLEHNNNHFDLFDSLESDEDLELLFDLLNSIKDNKGNRAVITPMCNLGNPNFDKIIASGFSEYFFQPLHETVYDYPKSRNIIKLWNQGKELGVFIPELHGREHVNIERYMWIIQHHQAKHGLRKAAELKSLGYSSYKGQKYPNYMGALHPSYKSEIQVLHDRLLHGGKIFKDYLGYYPRVFVAPNAEEPKELEATLHKIGVKYLNRAKRRVYPIGDGKFEKEWNFLGSKNQYGQIKLNRNAYFEPVAFGLPHLSNDWVNGCLKEMEIAYRWSKPAVISCHRVNFVSGISNEIRDKGLIALKQLLTSALKKWPDLEFMSSFELGSTISQQYL